MKDKINGGVYSVHFSGTEGYAFKGIHPALIIRTLKEDMLYLCVPLTTYTDDRWRKCKEKGWGCKINSCNSIARVDKICIISVNDIKNRWINTTTGRFDRLTSDELHKINEKLQSYIKLSGDKSEKEYGKYYIEYDFFESEFLKAYDINTGLSVFKKTENNSQANYDCDKKLFNDISTDDMLNILKVNLKENFSLSTKSQNINIIVFKTQDIIQK